MNRNNISDMSGWRKLTILAAGLCFIVVGLFILGNNLGLVSQKVLSIVVSWKMLLIVIGGINLIRRRLATGMILIAVGFFFLLPNFFNVSPEFLRDGWPLLLILIGIFLLLKLMRPTHKLRKTDINMQDEDGYVTSNSSFTNSRHIVLEPYFKGAELQVAFGSISLDLRRTQLIEKGTCISVDISFGGMELFIPSSWNVTIEANTSFSGIEDKRSFSPQVDNEQILIIRGNVSFGGVEIKS